MDFQVIQIEQVNGLLSSSVKTGNLIKYTWVCSQHFVSGEKSSNHLAPNYVPDYVGSPVKQRLENETNFIEGKP